MTEFKAQLNMRLSSDVNVSFAVTAVIADQSEAEAFGRDVNLLVTAWCKGYDEQSARSSE